ncbi:MAG TPA: hypothetical protein VGH53_22445, partial [Streptosporangiaceae bacterium]
SGLGDGDAEENTNYQRDGTGGHHPDGAGLGGSLRGSHSRLRRCLRGHGSGLVTAAAGVFAPDGTITRYETVCTLMRKELS